MICYYSWNYTDSLYIQAEINNFISNSINITIRNKINTTITPIWDKRRERYTGFYLYDINGNPLPNKVVICEGTPQTTDNIGHIFYSITKGTVLFDGDSEYNGYKVDIDGSSWTGTNYP